MELKQRINELEGMLESADLSLATRRLMDLVAEHHDLQDLRPEATQLRKEYNMRRGLGELELKDERSTDLSAKGHALLKKIQSRDLGNLPLDQLPRFNVFSCQGMRKAYRSRTHNFDLGPIDLAMRTGQITGVVGENGNGKTTLLRQIAGLLNIDGGQRDYPDLAEDQNQWYQAKHHIAWIPQRSERWNGTMLQSLSFMAGIHGLCGQENVDRVDFTIHRLGLTRFQHLTWKQLSSGYKLRAELAKMVVWRPRLLVLDEPIANLDLQAQQLFLQDLRHLADSARYPMSIILSSQQLHEIESIADNIIFLRNGNPEYNGAVKDFGLERQENIFEVAGKMDRERILAALTGESVRVEHNGLVYNVVVPRSMGSREFLRKLDKADLKINYFRDISTSTRKLFHQDP